MKLKLNLKLFNFLPFFLKHRLKLLKYLHKHKRIHRPIMHLRRSQRPQLPIRHLLRLAHLHPSHLLHYFRQPRLLPIRIQRTIHLLQLIQAINSLEVLKVGQVLMHHAQIVMK